MKSQEPQEKKFRQLSDEELEKVNGGILPFLEDFISCYNLTLCEEQGKQLDTKTCKCYLQVFKPAHDYRWQKNPMPNTVYRLRIIDIS